MSDIKPQGTRVTISTTSEGNCGGEGCPQFAKSTFEQYQPSECKVTGLKAILWLPCPVAARRNAALLRECRMMFEVVLDQEGFHMGDCLDDDIRALLERIGE